MLPLWVSFHLKYNKWFKVTLFSLLADKVISCIRVILGAIVDDENV